MSDPEPHAHADEPAEDGGDQGPSEVDIGRICDWWCDTAVEARLTIPEMRQAARDALNALRSAPVAERMATMGMKRWESNQTTVWADDVKAWVER